MEIFTYKWKDILLYNIKIFQELPNKIIIAQANRGSNPKIKKNSMQEFHKNSSQRMFISMEFDMLTFSSCLEKRNIQFYIILIIISKIIIENNYENSKRWIVQQ